MGCSDPADHIHTELVKDIDNEISEPKISVNTGGWPAGSSDLTARLVFVEGPILHFEFLDLLPGRIGCFPRINESF